MIEVRNKDIERYLRPDSCNLEDFASVEVLHQQVMDNPNLIHVYHGNPVQLAEGIFELVIDSWMDLEFIEVG